MSREVVVRVGTGPLHIRTPGRDDAICGRKLPADLTTWPRGKASAAVWANWKRCRTCEQIHEMLTR